MCNAFTLPGIENITQGQVVAGCLEMSANLMDFPGEAHRRQCLRLGPHALFKSKPMA
jgi:hypothetical protein